MSIVCSNCLFVACRWSLTASFKHLDTASVFKVPRTSPGSSPQYNILLLRKNFHLISNGYTPPRAHRCPCECLDFSVQKAKSPSLTTRPGLERSLASYGNELLNGKFVTNSRQICLYMGIPSNRHTSMSNCRFPPSQDPHRRRCSTHL
jgi:hypothetical protein